MAESFMEVIKSSTRCLWNIRVFSNKTISHSHIQGALSVRTCLPVECTQHTCMSCPCGFFPILGVRAGGEDKTPLRCNPLESVFYHRWRNLFISLIFVLLLCHCWAPWSHCKRSELRTCMTSTIYSMALGRHAGMPYAQLSRDFCDFLGCFFVIFCSWWFHVDTVQGTYRQPVLVTIEILISLCWSKVSMVNISRVLTPQEHNIPDQPASKTNIDRPK